MGPRKEGLRIPSPGHLLTGTRWAPFDLTLQGMGVTLCCKWGNQGSQRLYSLPGNPVRKRLGPGGRKASRPGPEKVQGAAHPAALSQADFVTPQVTIPYHLLGGRERERTTEEKHIHF